jgi:hypothetical protein
MRAPERWPTGSARRSAIAAGVLFALLILGVLIWKIASTPPPRGPESQTIPVNPPQ